MAAGAGILVVHGFAVREGRNKWACCFELRLRLERSEALLYRGEVHGCSFVSEHAARLAACEAGEREARRRVAAGLAQSYTSACGEPGLHKQ
ncbi:hypothetical protein [Cupriavidus sp. AU9028]|uniref:hypothetical protein n=1 Tax=Cupriavidus sp. AU9028 TaxID=2871157 RepID=UPI001C979EFC|nr:hypothetical protein [Cupriavidus sp. AU9028]MBY4896865.1 hypothetical protein [Cupriavidus sp. AU9028]